MNNIQASIDAITRKIIETERRYHRAEGSVALLAVSKKQPACAIRTAAAAGLRRFGENYAQEAIPKMESLRDLPLEWHFIGSIQSNKTQAIAAHFAWVHTIDKPKIARRLDQQRPLSMPRLNVCVEVNISGEASKSGVSPAQLPELVGYIHALQHLRLRGLMALPAPSADFASQCVPYQQLRELLDHLNQGLEPRMDTLSIGTSDDFVAAIAQGATLIRLGTAIFGARNG